MHRYRRWLEVILVVAAILLSIFIIHKLAFLVIAYSFYRIMRVLPSPFGGVITRFILTFLIFFSLNTILGFAAWLLHISLSVHLMTAFYGVVALLLALFSRNSIQQPIGLSSSAEEITTLAVAIAIFFAAFAPFIHGHTPLLATRVLAAGGDNMGHFELTYAVDKNQGYIQNHYYSASGIITGTLTPYPEGLHLNVGILGRVFQAATHPFDIGGKLFFFLVATDVNLALLTYLFVIYCFSLNRRILAAGGRLATYLSVLTVTGLMFLGPFFSLFAIGFQPELASLTLLLSEVLLLNSVLGISDKARQKTALLFAAILVSGIAYTYIVLWPIALVALLLGYHQMIGLSKVQLAKHKFLVAALTGIIAAGLGQFFYQLLYQSSTSVNQNGFIPEPNNFLLLFLFTVSALFILYRHKGPTIKLLSRLLIFSAVITILLLIYQLISVGELRYFYYKSAYTFILLAAALGTVAISLLIYRVLKATDLKPYAFGGLILLVVLSVGGLVWAERSQYFNLYAQEKPFGLSLELADGILTIDNKNPDDGHRVIAIGSCNREQDIDAMRIAAALTNNPNPGQEAVYRAQMFSPHRSRTFAAIKKYLKTQPYLIVLSTDYGTQQALTRYLGKQASKIRFVNLDYGHTYKNIVSCPNFLR